MQVQSVASAPATSSASQSAPNALGEQQFFELLVTQLQHQNPLEPQDNSEFIAQLAQFSSLEQLQSLSAQMSSLNMLSSSLNNAQAVNLMGRGVLFQSDELHVQTAGAAQALEAELPPGLTSGTIEIQDEQGRTIRTLSIPEGAGRQSVPWDGLDEHGVAAPPGVYRLQVSGTAADGNSTAGTSFVRGKVEGVRFSGGVVYLDAGAQSITMDRIVEILSEPASASSMNQAMRAFSMGRR